MSIQTEHKLIYYIKKWVALNQEEENLVLSAFEEIEVKKKQQLLKPKQLCNYVYFIKQGGIRSFFVDEKGHEHIYQLRLDNSWISDLESFFSQHPSKYYLEAMEDSSILRISHQRIELLYREIPQLERYFRILFQKAYVNALERLNATMWDTAVERYDQLMEEHKDIFQRVPLVYIASYLGIAPESLSRIRKQQKS